MSADIHKFLMVFHFILHLIQNKFGLFCSSVELELLCLNHKVKFALISPYMW